MLKERYSPLAIIADTTFALSLLTPQHMFITIATSIDSIIFGANMSTSKKDASKAGKLLKSSPNKDVKSVAGSDLAQAKRKPKKK